MKIERILAPVDFSELSEAAARHAAALAAQFRAQLTFFHSMFPEIYRYYGLEGGGAYVPQVYPVPEELLADVRRQLDALIAKVAPDVDVRPAVAEGEPVAEIVNYAKENQVDLVVMPTRGFGPFRRFVLGSVTAKVLDDIACPVFTCPHGADLALKGPRPYRRIACAVDLSDHSEAVLRWAAGFARASEAELTVIHAAPWLRVGGFDLGLEVRRTVMDAVREEISRLLDKVGCEAAILPGTGDVAEAVPEMAREIEADLLVIGRTSKGGPLGRLRAHTYSLIRESPCPVASV